MKQILITGDRSGSGKTSITLALAALLSKKHRVQTFKVGMDYIDPSYLSAVSGRPCRNLDSFTLSDEQIHDIFQFGCRGADMAIVEGVRGLYEGAEALNDVGSTAAIAKTLNLAVVLVVSA
jgi:cobyrinic acid a,c-diamide synthase